MRALVVATLISDGGATAGDLAAVGAAVGGGVARGLAARGGVTVVEAAETAAAAVMAAGLTATDDAVGVSVGVAEGAAAAFGEVAVGQHGEDLAGSTPAPPSVYPEAGASARVAATGSAVAAASGEGATRLGEPRVLCSKGLAARALRATASVRPRSRRSRDSRSVELPQIATRVSGEPSTEESPKLELHGVLGTAGTA